MNDRNPQRPPGDEHDRVVEDFFAAHRSRIVDQGSDEDTWQVIRERAGRGPRRSRGMWFLAGAVAASAVGVAVLAGQGLGGPVAGPAATGGDDRAPVTATAPGPSEATATDRSGPVEAAPTRTADGATSTAQPTPRASSEVTSAPVTGASAGPLVLPAPDPAAQVLLVAEPSGEESDLRVAQLTYDCAAAAMEWDCPGLAVSEDAGRTWTARVDMFEAGYYWSAASRDRAWMWGPGEDAAQDRPGVPDPSGGLVRSDDAGRTWTPVPTRGVPMAVQAFRSTLVVVTEGCEGGAAGGCAEVVVTDVDTDDATTGRRLVKLPDLPTPRYAPPGLLGAELAATYDAVYVTYAGTTYRIADGEETATVVRRPAEECELGTAPESQDTLVHWCHGSDAVQLSHDGGATWEEVAGPGGTTRRVASNDGRRLALATDDTLWVGGAEGWEAVLPWSPGRTLLDAHGGSSMSFGGAYRYDPQGAHRSSQRWVTDDDWQTWTELPGIEVGAGG
ncbi:hypothetical protein [Ornithinimicrobium pekingense]|uniref:Exo-alpha-sialidase n=1 Tax=Ornithinimicrobium pekingense TaxID=384677 RepID=A0ABQ2F7R3_9MICO|nr:hypothetical protein [Ornithinimicrobium pekingense]GGK70292.1 hypothetical protein GCM10011509_18390 [Ornithinimicrobium pekingense]